MPNYILSHTSSFKSAWTWFILVLTLYTAVMVPYSVAFQYKGAAKHSSKQVLFWLVIDSFVDVVFIADIVVNFMTSLISDSGELIKGGFFKKFKKYLKKSNLPNKPKISKIPKNT